MEKLDLFKSFLNGEFWNEHNHRISKDLFPDQLEDLFDSLVVAHDTIKGDVTCRDLYNIHCARFPTITTAKRGVLIELIKNINEAEPLSKQAAKYVLDKALIEVKATNIARVALEISQGKHEDWDKIEDILRTDARQEEIKLVSTDIKQILAERAEGKYIYNLKELHSAVGPIQLGTLNILAGPVNAGKSALALSFAVGPGGFLDQGAKVLYVVNEESYRKTMSRCFSCFTGLTESELKETPDKAQEIFNKIKDKLWMIQEYEMSFNKLNHIIDKMRPDIVVLDMIDKIAVSRAFAREDQRLGYLYEQGRETAKRFDCVVFGLSQTDAKSFGKLYYSFNHLHSSKVEKAANADTVITIGAQSGDFTADCDNNFRVLNLAKTKDEGNGKRINCQIQPLLSRFVA